MIPKRGPCACFERSEDGWEVSCVTDTWEDDDFDETFYFHFLNIWRFKIVHEYPDVFSEVLGEKSSKGRA